MFLCLVCIRRSSLLNKVETYSPVLVIKSRIQSVSGRGATWEGGQVLRLVQCAGLTGHSIAVVRPSSSPSHGDVSSASVGSPRRRPASLTTRGRRTDPPGGLAVHRLSLSSTRGEWHAAVLLVPGSCLRPYSTAFFLVVLCDLLSSGSRRDATLDIRRRWIDASSGPQSNWRTVALPPSAVRQRERHSRHSMTSDYSLFCYHVAVNINLLTAIGVPNNSTINGNILFSISVTDNGVIFRLVL